MNGDLDTCGCCEGSTLATPAAIDNPPGLARLSVRAGTHGVFKSAMLANLSNHRALDRLRTREDDDPAIGVLDAWATVLDVLTFYDERIANEGFLRTASERRSILELARAIGYELAPGVAASTHLAFTLETLPGAPDKVKVPIGVRAQSIPGQDEKPQVFETVVEIEARPAWNELKPKQKHRVLPVFGDDTVTLAGTSANLKPGDALLLVGDERQRDMGSERWDFRRVKEVALDSKADQTLVTFDRGLGSVNPEVHPAANPRVYALRKRFNLFGSTAADFRAMPKSLRAAYLGKEESAVTNTAAADLQWPRFTVRQVAAPEGGSGLLGEYYSGTEFQQRKLVRVDPQVEFNWGANSPDPALPRDNFSVRWSGFICPVGFGSGYVRPDYCTFYVQSDDGCRLWIDGKLIIDDWNDHAVRERAGTVWLDWQVWHDIRLEYYERTGVATVALSWSSPGMSKQVIRKSVLYPHVVQIDGAHEDIVAGGWLVLKIPEYEELYEVVRAAEDARADFGISGKTTQLTLKGEHAFLFNDRLRETAVFGVNEELTIAEVDIPDPVSGKTIELDQPVDGLRPGQWIAFTGTPVGADEAVSEVVQLATDQLDGKTTFLHLATDLLRSYQRSSVVINANVAPATHGETRREVLGSGNNAQGGQAFVLKQSPLTYVSAATASGGKSTLDLRVGGVRWDESATLYGREPAERVYTLRQSDDGKTTVRFGDGLRGARLPSGVENIAAQYRIGTGKAGMVRAGQVSLLLDRLLGLKAVANPRAPSGAEDPEPRDRARVNAPKTVLTLDRIVSLSDFADFARAFSGVAKAAVTWLWDGEKRIVHLTIAGEDGEVLDQTTDTYKNLLDAIDLARDPNQPVRVDGYLDRPCRLSASIRVDAAYEPDSVRAAVQARLVEKLAFDARDLGQVLTSSEVIALIQPLPGVVMVDLDVLDKKPGSLLRARIPAHLARWNGAVTEGAELLRVAAADIVVTVKA